MNGSLSSNALTIFEPLLCLLALFLLVRSGQRWRYRQLSLLLCSHVGFALVLVPLLLFGGHGINAGLAYRAYVFGYMADLGAETILSLLVVYTVFDLAMVPLEGIRELGILVFRWAACMSCGVVLGSVLVPHLNQKHFLTNLLIEVQRTESILILCLLLFVCFAIRPLGLSYGSRVFGVILGLGILAAKNLAASIWIPQTKQMYALGNMMEGLATCVAFLLWAAYFAAPESKRSIIVLPATSPFLRWNQVAHALGEAPGFVAVGGIPPELFAPAELEVMRRASLQMVSQSVAPRDRTQTA